MKYADCPTVEVDVWIEAPSARVWSIVTDIDTPTRFSSELQEARWLGPATAPTVGARFVGRNQHPAAGEWETTSVVTVLEPGRSFGWAVGDADHPSASWRFDLTEEGTGVRLRQWAQIGPAPSGLTRAITAMPDKEERIVAGRLEEHRTNMRATVEGIKALAEHGPGS
ncbi:MAG: SRPBCC family protein [Acidimicrobiales bacterium]